MAKKRSNRNSLMIAVVSILLGLLALIINKSLFDLFFVAIVIAVLWRDADRIGDLQKRIAELEKPGKEQQEQSPSPQRE